MNAPPSTHAMPCGHSLSGGHGFGAGQVLGLTLVLADFCVTPPCAVVRPLLATVVTPIAPMPSQIVRQDLCMPGRYHASARGRIGAAM
jgi:hypothetical protein